jgi:hypothetical protein
MGPDSFWHFYNMRLYNALSGQLTNGGQYLTENEWKHVVGAIY